MALFFTLSAESLESGLSGPGLLDGGSRHRNFVLGVLLHESLELEDDILVDLLHRGFVEFSPKLQNNLRVVCRHVRHHVSFHLQVILGVAFVVTCDSLVKVAQVVEPELRVAFRAIKGGRLEGFFQVRVVFFAVGCEALLLEDCPGGEGVAVALLNDAVYLVLAACNEIAPGLGL